MKPHLIVLACVMTILSSACAVNGLSFVQDDRVTILSPSQDEEITLPFDLVWTSTDYEGRFGVFFDLSPMRPGQRPIDLVPKRDPCRTLPECPTDEWLTDRNISLTSATRLSIASLPDLRPGDHGVDRHTVTIVLLDHDDRRQGESAFIRELLVQRDLR